MAIRRDDAIAHHIRAYIVLCRESIRVVVPIVGFELKISFSKIKRFGIEGKATLLPL